MAGKNTAVFGIYNGVSQAEQAVDGILFLGNFAVQRDFIFSKR